MEEIQKVFLGEQSREKRDIRWDFLGTFEGRVDFVVGMGHH